MSLTTALNSALSALSAQGRASAVASDNIANALTPGYARRSLALESDSAGGVRPSGITRHVDPALLAERRATDAALGGAEAAAAFHARFAAAVGQSGDPASIAGRLAAFESSLIAAASRPDSVQRLDTVALRARDLTGAISQASQTLQDMRGEADRKIAVQVERLNALLQDVEALNGRITAMSGGTADTAALLDRRQALVDEINTIAPVNVVERDFGRIALYTNGGAILLDGPAARLSFAPVHTIVPEMKVGGALSGLELNGRSLRTDSARGALAGGTLGAQFAIRDELAVSAQTELDALARDLVERFEDPGLDPSLAAGAAGLFTDGGAAFDPTRELGLAARLAVNAAADPAQGGASWRLRDGLGAAAPGPVGEARFLQDLAAALASKRQPASGNFGTGLLSASEIGASVLSASAQAAAVADRRLSFAAAAQTEMQQAELQDGVDTDTELGNLMLIEQAYAANARMIEVVDGLMKTLLRL